MHLTKVWTGLAAVFLGSFAAPSPRTGNPPPNVLLIVLDDVGLDSLSMYNDVTPVDAQALTPQLDLFASTGVRFTKVYANPLCSPTRALLLTGKYAFRTGFGNLADCQPLPMMPCLDLTGTGTLPEVLKTVPNTPYVSGAFGKWHLSADVELSDPIDQGFDYFAGQMDNPGSHFNWDLVVANAGSTTTSNISSTTGAYAAFDARVTRRNAVSWINGQTDPFFAYVCFSPPHRPFQAPAQQSVSVSTWNQITSTFNPSTQMNVKPGDILSGGLARVGYDWMLEAVDTEIGLLLSSIDPRVRQNTLVLIIGDNGTPAPLLSAPYFPAHGKGTVYEQGTRVPLIASGPGVDSQGMPCHGLVGAVDVFSTIVEITGAVPMFPLTDGISFSPIMSHPAVPSNRSFAFTQIFLDNGFYTPSPTAYAFPPRTLHDRALTDGRFKYLRFVKWSESSQLHATTEAAYDLQSDPLETVNLLLSPGTLSPEAEMAINSLRQEMTTLSGL